MTTSSALAILLDLDGTMVLTEDVYFKVWSQILQKYNLVLTSELYSQYIHSNSDSKVFNTLLYNIQDLDLFALSKLKDDSLIEMLQQVQLVPGIIEFLQMIRDQQHRTCVVTNSNHRVAQKILEHFGLDTLIDFIISADSCTRTKPDPEPYRIAMEKLGISATNTIVFEDSKTGIMSAKGMNPKLIVGLETTYPSTILKLFGANITIPNFTNLSLSELLKFHFDQDDQKLLLSKAIQSAILFSSSSSSISSMSSISSSRLSTVTITDEPKLKGGFIADVIRVQINETECIFKYENTNQTDLQQMAHRLDLYEREYYFYEMIAPFCREIICLPRMIAIVHHPETNIHGILLEDLFFQDCTPNLNLNTESIDLSFKIIDRMARMHARFWNSNLKSSFPKLKDNCNESFRPFFTEFVQSKIHEFISKWHFLMTHEQMIKFLEISQNFANIQLALSGNNATTLIHGDIKSPNIFYRKSDLEPFFIDWQHCAIGKGVQDLVFFMIESFDLVHLKQYYPLMVQYYYLKLREYGIEDYSDETFQTDLQNARNYVPVFTSVWFGTVPSDELIDKNFPFLFIQKLLSIQQL
jgi:beta-phosphoglucomutase